MRRSRLLALSFAVSFAACSSLHDDLSREFLDPESRWLVEPAQLGLDAESFEIAVDGGSLTGFLVRGKGSEGRTVVLFHGNGTNASMLHPYYTFLAAAGLNVVAFDYRGFGQSKGTASLRGMVYDTSALLAWLRGRNDVDASRIAFYGLGLGGVAALHAAAHGNDCKAIAVEDVPSLRDAVRTRIENRGQVAGTLATGFAEFAGLPEDIEPSDNTGKLSMPSLWLAGNALPKEELRAHLRAYFEMHGDKQLWLLPDTARVPHSLLTHDGEYQRAVAGFLRSALDGKPESIAVDWRRTGGALAGTGTWEIALQRKNSGAAIAPCAVQVCAIDSTGAATFSKVWLEGERGSVRLELAAEPGAVSAMRIADAEPTVQGVFARSLTPLSRAGRWYEENLSAFTRITGERLELDAIKAIAKTIRDRDEAERLPPVAESQLAAVFAAIGAGLAASTDAEDRAAALVWLERAVAATPAHPDLHFWPGAQPTYGFPQANAIAAARELLAKLRGR